MRYEMVATEAEAIQLVKAARAKGLSGYYMKLRDGVWECRSWV